MNVLNRVFVCVILLGGYVAGSLTAQARSDLDEVLRLAVRTVFDSIALTSQPNGGVHIDLSALPANVDRNAIAGRLDMTPVRRADVVRCPPMEGRTRVDNCFIDGAEYLIVIHELTVSAASAVVEVEIRWEGEGADYRVVPSAGYLVLLGSNGEEWSVTDVKHLWET